MRRIPIALFLVACSTLMLEIVLTRVFDVILYPNLAYMVITCAMFSLGLAGIYRALRPLPPETDVRHHLVRVLCAYGLAILLVRPTLNVLPFDFGQIAAQPGRQALYFAAMYVVVGLPFFFAGHVFSVVFSSFAREIRKLYAWDLAGAAVGCVILLPALPAMGPGGLMLGAAGMALAAAALLVDDRRRAGALLAVGSILAVVPLMLPDYLDFPEHKPDRGLAAARARGESELVHWDPISKIEVIGWGAAKNVIYDGGSQSSFLYPFDGDYAGLRERLDAAVRSNNERRVIRHFWYRGVFASHWFLRDRGQSVLVIGSAAGQEVKAALLYGAERVDAVEMVGTVVDLGLNEYAEFNGGIFHDPRVHVVAGEGRSVLRRLDRTWDIIQLHSDHSSSSVAAGVGALDPTYLLTTDAFREYFSHLSDDGVLHINHHVVPRIVTTAARAWRELGHDDFRRHVVVVRRNTATADTLPTMLVKMRPWTAAELREIRTFFSIRPRHEPLFRIAENPLDPDASFLSDAFYAGEVPAELQARVPYRLAPATDDRPYLKFFRRTLGRVEVSRERFVDVTMQHLMNEPVERGPGIPIDVLHLFVVGGLSIAFAIVFVLVPLLGSPAGRAPWPGRARALVYFACLGAGFIVLELVFIQQLMRFVGSPLYTYAVVLFTLLLAAGIGSVASSAMGVEPGRRTWVPFAGILVTGMLFVLGHDAMFGLFYRQETLARVLVAAVALFPIGFFLGMPFPLGILGVRHVGRSAIAWAWGMNGLFTVIGGLSSVLLSVAIGFLRTEMIGLALYAIAWLALPAAAKDGRAGSGETSARDTSGRTMDTR